MAFQRAKAALAGTRFADLHWVAETGSTNADMVGLLRAAGPSARPVVLVADHQTAGRGRLDRIWEAPPGASLLMSIGLPLDRYPEERWSLLTGALGGAATDALEGLRLKWPNDLVAVGAGPDGTDRKVGGILAELHDLPGAGHCAVLGLGANLNWPEVPAHLQDIATSMNLLLGGPVDAEVVLTDLLVSFDQRWLPLIERSAPTTAEFHAAWAARSATLGRRVRVELPDAVLVGTAVDLATDGALVVEDDQAVRRTVRAGDVVHLRPEG